jgi:hypothetical protein
VGYASEDPSQTPGGIRPCFEVHPTRRPDGTFGIGSLDTLDMLGFFVELVETPSAERIIAAVDALGAR